MGIFSKLKWLFSKENKPLHSFTSEESQSGIATRSHNRRIKELEIQIKETELKRQLDEAREDRLTSTNNTGFEEKVVDIIQNYLEDYESGQEQPNDLTSFLKLLPSFMGQKQGSTGSEAQLSNDPVIAAQQLSGQTPSSPVPPSSPPVEEVPPEAVEILKDSIEPGMLEELAKTDEKTFVSYAHALWKDLNKSKP